jgi:hypothetical protein
MKYKVCVPVDYVQGYLRYGHFEITIDSPTKLTKEEIVEIAKKDIRFNGELIVDDYSVEDYGDLELEDMTYEEIE